jgi:hypothetical protein
MLRNVMGSVFAFAVLIWSANARLHRHRTYAVPAAAPQAADAAESTGATVAADPATSGATDRSAERERAIDRALTAAYERRNRAPPGSYVSFEPGKPMIDPNPSPGYPYR